MNYKKHFLPLLVMVPALLASCGSGGNTTSSATSAQPVINDLKDMVDYLAKNHNFTLDIEIYGEDGSTIEEYSRYYTNEYVYDENAALGWGYAKVGNKYAELAPVEDAPRIGYEVVGKTALYDGSFLTFSDFGSDLVSGSNDIALTTKKSRLLFLNIFDLSADVFTSIVYSSITYNNGVLYGSIGTTTNYEASFYVREVGTTSNPEVEAIIKDGKPYENDIIENQVYDMFMENNYQRNCYEDGVYIGAEHFLPRYFYGEYTDEYKAATGAYSYGLIGLNNVKLSTTIKEGLVKDTTYNGSYYFSIHNFAVNIVTTNPYNVNPDVTSRDVYNYPSNMILWNKLYAFDHYDDGEQVEFVTPRVDFAVDFAKNFQVYNTLIENGCTPSSLKLICKDLDGANTTVSFILGYTFKGSEYYAEYEFSNFGTADKIEVTATLDKIDKYNVN
ncbi:MAG: hypothetical protein MJ239_00030 [Bacilli bacterium]|nr:hypothetical protein [Bacilli bacterium]